jgi:tetratricopeptide (TPR) repeat protein
LRKALTRDPADFPSCRQLAGLLEKDEAWPEMIRVVETALSIDPFDVEMRRLALKGYAKTENREKVLETLGQMTLLDPAHAVDYRLQRVDSLCELERRGEAKKEILQVLEEMPYFWEAQNRLLRIVEQETKTRAEKSGP